VGLYVRFQEANFNAVGVADFLRVLLQQIRGHVILLWDGAKIHKGPIVKEVLDRFPRLHIEWFPGYAPELNPAEQIWNDFKRHSGNSLPITKQDIRLSLHGSARRVRRSPRKLRSFILASDLPSPPW